MKKTAGILILSGEIMRHPQPKLVKDYYAKVEAFYDMKEPKCCHTCDSYSEEGICHEYLIAPPEEFAQQLNQCEKWIPIIPF